MTPLPRQRPRGPGQWAAVAGALAVLMLVCGAPLLAIVVRAGHAVLWGQGAAVWLQPETLAALWNTLRFSVMALVLATVLGLVHALAVRAMDVWGLGRRAGGVAVDRGAGTAGTGGVAGTVRMAGLGARALALLWRAAAFLPFVVSPVTVAFGLLLVYPQWTASLGLLVAAYALLAYPFVAKSLTAALDSLPASYAQAAATLGARPWRVFWRVTLPLVGTALRRGMAFAAATALGEFAVSLFLSRPEWTTLTTLIYQHLGRPGAANLDAALVLACGLMALALLAFTGIEGRTQDNERHA